MLRTVRLYGRLRRQFTSEYRLEADSPAEVVRALCTMVPGFEDAIRDGAFRFVRGDKKEGMPVIAPLMHMTLGKVDTLHLIPVPAVEKSGFGKVLLGSVMIGAAFATGGASIASMSAVSFGGATVAGATSSLVLTGVMGFVAKMGLVMVLGGISSMLSPQPKMKLSNEEKNSSFSFGGAVNTAQQGVAVPIVYGRVLAGSVVVSAGIDVEQLMTVNNGYGTGGILGLAATIAHYYPLFNKGGKGGGGGSAKEDPNSLQSNSTARIIDLISEGPCGGLAASYLSGVPEDCLKSVYFNDVRVKNDDGSFNYNGMVVSQRVGNPSDEPMEGFSDTESEINVGVELTKVTPLVRSISDTNVESVRITVQLPSLYQITDEGEIKGTDVSFKVEVQPSGGSYTQVMVDTISGKTNSPYLKAYRIALPGSGPWNIRLTRITDDSTEAKLANATNWVSYTEIIESKLTYPNSAMVGVTVDAQQFGTFIPNRAYDWFGRIIKVPTNYDPVTRAYATSGAGTSGGVWDGTFKDAWTDNPAWIFYDLLTHERYGLGQFIPVEYPNKWALYEIGRYCDQLVPDGSGGTEPRYTINTQINDRGEAWELLQSIVSVFRGMIYWGSGAIEFSYDHDEAPVKLISPANVIGGKINYSTDAFSGRHSVVILSWNDPELNHRTNYEIVEDPELIAKYGYKPIEVDAWGCTSRGQAHRMGRWILDTEKYGEIASYSAGLDHSDLRPGAIIEINDPEFTANRMAGRTGTGSTTSAVKLDAPVTLQAGQTYKVRVVLPNGVVEQRNVTNGAGVTSTLNLSSALSAVPLDGGVWSLSSNLVTPRLFKVLGVEESGPLEFNVTCMWHDPNKYARVEEGMDLPPNNFSNVPSGPLGAPTSVDLKEFYYREGNASMPGVMVSWTASSDPRVTKYQYQVKLPGINAWGDLFEVAGVSDTIRDVGDGLWSVRVRSANDEGQKSIWVAKEDVVIGNFRELPVPTGLAVVKETKSYNTVLMWDLSVDERPLEYEVMFGTTTTFADAVSTAKVTGSRLVLTRPGYYWVRTRYGQYYSDPAGPEGADDSMFHDPAMLADRLVTEVLDDLDFNTQAILEQALRVDDYAAVMDSRTLVEGQPVGTTFAEFRDEQVLANAVTATALNLIGAKSEDGTAWVLDLSHVKVSPGMTLAQYLGEVGASTGDITGTVALLMEIMTGEDGTEARAVIKTDVNGNFAGIVLASGEEVSRIGLIADNTVVAGPDGDVLALFSTDMEAVGGGVYIPNLRVDRISYGAMDAEFIAGQVISTWQGSQEMPGGLIMKWGRYREYITNEVTRTVTFDKPFPNACFSVVPVPHLNTWNDHRDLFCQTVGEPAKTGFTIGFQRGEGSGAIDGCNWLAFGY